MLDSCCCVCSKTYAVLYLTHKIKLHTSFLLALVFVVLGCHQQLDESQILNKIKKTLRMQICIKLYPKQTEMKDSFYKLFF